jgi:hypothetical protein
MAHPVSSSMGTGIIFRGGGGVKRSGCKDNHSAPSHYQDNNKRSYIYTPFTLSMTWRWTNLPFHYFRILIIEKCVYLLNSEYSKCESRVVPVRSVKGSGVLAPVTLQLCSRLRSVDVFTHGTLYLRVKVILFQALMRLGSSRRS